MDYKEAEGSRNFWRTRATKYGSTYGQHNDGMAVFNFAYEDGDYILSRLIKVKVPGYRQSHRF